MKSEQRPIETLTPTPAPTLIVTETTPVVTEDIEVLDKDDEDVKKDDGEGYENDEGDLASNKAKLASFLDQFDGALINDLPLLYALYKSAICSI